MKRILATVLAALCCAWPALAVAPQQQDVYRYLKQKKAAAFIQAGGSITVVQHKSTNCTGSVTSCSLAFTSNNAAGNLLVYLCADNDNTHVLNASTDNNTNTISNATFQNLGTLGQTRIDFVSSSHSGANTASCNSPVGTRIHIHIWEISGTTGTLDKTNTGTQTATNQSISTSVATTAANEIVFGFFYDQPNDDSLTAGAGFSPSEFTDGGGGNESALSEVKIVSATGVQTATATCGSSSNIIMQSIVTFK